MSSQGQNQVLDEKHCFQEIPPAVTIVFVCFSMFYQGRSSVNFPMPNTHECEHTGACLCRHYTCAWSWGGIPRWMEGTSSVPQEFQGQHISTIIKSLSILRPFLLLQQRPLSVFEVSYWSHFLLKLQEKCLARPTLMLIHLLDSYLNDVANNFQLWIQIYVFLSTRKRGTMFLSSIMRTGYKTCRALYKVKMQAPCWKTIKNFMTVKGENQTKLRAL